MKIKHHAKNILLGCTAALLFFTATVQAADPTGTWTWSTPGRNGSPDRVSILILKADASKLTGKISAPGRDGQAVETPIAGGKIEGDNISFDLVRSYNGNSSTNKYSGVVTVEKINGKVESINRNGEPQSRNWDAKRSTETK
jgi:hypothetical protein